MFFQHLVFWIGFLFINLYVSLTFLPHPVGYLRFIALTVVNIAAYSVCYTYWVKNYYETKRYTAFVIALLGTIVISSAIRMISLYFIHKFSGVPIPRFMFSGGSSFGPVFVIITQAIVVVMAALLSISKNKMIAENLLSEIMAAKTQTELSLIKAKINPHFLLNTLNNIYYYSSEDSVKGGNAIIKLGELLRYTIYDSSQTRITLEKELNTIESLSQLYALRFNSVPNISVKLVDDSMLSMQIPPNILLILFENALKYSAVGTQINSYIRVNIERGDYLSITVENSIADAVDSLQNIYGGLGLKSLKQILDMEYQGKYSLVTNEVNATFTAQLNILHE